MGASFRSKEQVMKKSEKREGTKSKGICLYVQTQIIELAGCDYLTISPKLLEDLAKAPGDAVVRKLDKDHPVPVREKWVLDQKEFAWALNNVRVAITSSLKYANLTLRRMKWHTSKQQREYVISLLT